MWRWRNERGVYLESLLSISKHKLDNLVLIIDYNKIQSYDFIKNVCDLNPLSKKLKVLILKLLKLMANDISELEKTFRKIKTIRGKAQAIICHTIKGKGIRIAENNPEWHHKSFRF